MDRRNGYMLKGPSARRGYDWWWHSLVGVSEKTGQERSFFMEYYVVNPALGEDAPVLGQDPAVKAAGKLPSYAMIKAGCWGKGVKTQLHNFYPIKDFRASMWEMDVQIGDAIATDRRITGSVKVSPEDASRPEFMSDAGTMSWDLVVEKVHSYSVGYGTSLLFRLLRSFQMYWHVAGMLTRYEGWIECNGERFKVSKETSHGYQDKNWGRDYTSLWIWLNCNDFRDAKTGELCPQTSLDLGGAQPVVFGIPFPRRLLGAVWHGGKKHEFNFSKVWTRPGQRFECPEFPDRVEWNVDAWNRRSKVEIRFSCQREGMLNVNYENPDGLKLHNRLWNGGEAAGTLKLWEKKKGQWVLTADLVGKNGGCEYGEADKLEKD